GAHRNAPAGGDGCGALNNANFGLTTPNAALCAPDSITGFGARPYNWQTQITFDQQLRHNMSLGVGYFRTAWGAFTANQNAALSAGTVDFDPYCVTAPVDSRL